MTEDSQSGRAKERAAAKARRITRTAFRQSSFDLLASGYSLEQIAEARKVSVRTIQREIDSVIAARRLDAPERYVHLQVARLTKALRLADAFRARVIDATTESFVFELTGASNKIEQFVALMLPLGLVEVSRTGIVAIARGPEGMQSAP